MSGSSGQSNRHSGGAGQAYLVNAGLSGLANPPEPDRPLGGRSRQLAEIVMDRLGDERRAGEGWKGRRLFKQTTRRHTSPEGGGRLPSRSEGSRVGAAGLPPARCLRLPPHPAPRPPPPPPPGPA